MLKNKYPMLWECAKNICKTKREVKNFTGSKDLRKYVKDNKHLLPEVVMGYKVKI